MEALRTEVCIDNTLIIILLAVAGYIYTQFTSCFTIISGRVCQCDTLSLCGGSEKTAMPSYPAAQTFRRPSEQKFAVSDQLRVQTAQQTLECYIFQRTYDSLGWCECLEFMCRRCLKD